MQEGKGNRGNIRRLKGENSCKQGSEGACYGISGKGSTLQPFDSDHGWPGRIQFKKKHVKLHCLPIRAKFFSRFQLVYFKKEKWHCLI